MRAGNVDTSPERRSESACDWTALGQFAVFAFRVWRRCSWSLRGKGGKGENLSLRYSGVREIGGWRLSGDERRGGRGRGRDGRGRRIGRSLLVYVPISYQNGVDL